MQDASTAGLPLPAFWWREVPGTPTKLMLELGAELIRAGGECDVRIEDVAKRLGVQRRAIERARDELVAAGLLRMIPGGVGRPNTYAWGTGRRPVRQKSGPNGATTPTVAMAMPHDPTRPEIVMPGYLTEPDTQSPRIRVMSKMPHGSKDVRRKGFVTAGADHIRFSKSNSYSHSPTESQRNTSNSNRAHEPADVKSADAAAARASGGSERGTNASEPTLAPLTAAQAESERLLIGAGIDPTEAESDARTYRLEEVRWCVSAWARKKGVGPGLLRVMLRRGEGRKAIEAARRVQEAADTPAKREAAKTLTVGVPAPTIDLNQIDDLTIMHAAVAVWERAGTVARRHLRGVPNSASDVRSSPRWSRAIVTHLTHSRGDEGAGTLPAPSESPAPRSFA